MTVGCSQYETREADMGVGARVTTVTNRWDYIHRFLFQQQLVISPPISQSIFSVSERVHTCFPLYNYFLMLVRDPMRIC